MQTSARKLDDGLMPGAARGKYTLLGAPALKQMPPTFRPTHRFLNPRAMLAKQMQGPQIKAAPTKIDVQITNLSLTPAPGNPRVSVMTASAARDSGAVQSVSGINYMPSQAFIPVQSEGGHYKGTISVEPNAQDKQKIAAARQGTMPTARRSRSPMNARMGVVPPAMPPHLMAPRPTVAAMLRRTQQYAGTYGGGPSV